MHDLITLIVDAAQPTFMQQIQPYLVMFVSAVVPALGAWIVSELKANHRAASAAVVSAQQAVVTAQQAAQTVIDQTNGITERMEKRSNDQARNLIAAKDETIQAKNAELNALKASQAVPPKGE